MRLNTRGDITTPNTLILDSVHLLNLFQEMNTLVNLTSFGGHVQLVNSKFENMNLCGAVVKNGWKQVGLPDYT